DEQLRVREINAAVVVLGYLGMDRFVREIEKEGLVVLPLQELNRIAVKNIGDIAGRLHRLAVFVDIGIQVSALPLKAHPPIKPWAWFVVVTHVPLANERCFISGL